MNTEIETQLVAEIRAAFEQKEAHDGTFPDVVMGCANALLAARSEMPSDKAFSVWLAENALDHVNRDDRAAYLNLARHPELARQMIASVETRSIRLVWLDHVQPIIKKREAEAKAEAEEAARVRSDANPTSPGSPEPESDETPAPPKEKTAKTATEKRSNSDALVNVLPLKKVPATTPKIIKLLGEEAGVVYYRFFRSKNIAMLNTLAGKSGGVSALRSIALDMAAGNYGMGHDVTIAVESGIGPRTFFPELPLSWSRLRTKLAITAKNFRAVAKNLPDYKRLNDAVLEEQPLDKNVFCGQWWEKHVIKAEREDRTNVVSLPTPDGRLIPSGYPEHEPAAHLAPMADEDIVVCGQVIYKAGTADWETYKVIFAAYEFWDLQDRDLRRTGDTVASRGFQYRRVAPWLKLANPIFGQTFWNIGHAMAQNGDRFEETKAASKCGNFES